MGLAIAIDHEGAATDPDPAARVVFGVDRKHPCRSDDEVVKVGASLGKRHRVDDVPGGTET
jgi:hypothetical protein